MAPRLSLSFKLGEVGAERGPATLVNHPLLVGSGKRKERRQSGGRKEKGARRRGRIGQQVAARRRPDSSAAARWSVRRRRAHPVRSPFPREERAAARPAPGRRGDFPRPSLGSAKARSRRAYEGKGTGPPAAAPACASRSMPLNGPRCRIGNVNPPSPSSQQQPFAVVVARVHAWAADWLAVRQFHPSPRARRQHTAPGGVRCVLASRSFWPLG